MLFNCLIAHLVPIHASQLIKFITYFNEFLPEYRIFLHSPFWPTIEKIFVLKLLQILISENKISASVNYVPINQQSDVFIDIQYFVKVWDCLGFVEIVNNYLLVGKTKTKLFLPQNSITIQIQWFVGKLVVTLSQNNLIQSSAIRNKREEGSI